MLSQSCAHHPVRRRRKGRPQASNDPFYSNKERRRTRQYSGGRWFAGIIPIPRLFSLSSHPDRTALAFSPASSSTREGRPLREGRTHRPGRSFLPRRFVQRKRRRPRGVSAFFTVWREACGAPPDPPAHAAQKRTLPDPPFSRHPSISGGFPLPFAGFENNVRRRGRHVSTVPHRMDGTPLHLVGQRTTGFTAMVHRRHTRGYSQGSLGTIAIQRGRPSCPPWYGGMVAGFLFPSCAVTARGIAAHRGRKPYGMAVVPAFSFSFVGIFLRFSSIMGDGDPTAWPIVFAAYGVDAGLEIHRCHWRSGRTEKREEWACGKRGEKTVCIPAGHP